jgi:hypothetical protein
MDDVHCGLAPDSGGKSEDLLRWKDEYCAILDVGHSFS